MSTSTHPVAPEEVMAFLDGELSADRTEFVSAHIKECAECRQTADAFHDICASLAKWTAPTAFICFKEGVLIGRTTSRPLTNSSPTCVDSWIGGRVWHGVAPLSQPC